MKNKLNQLPINFRGGWQGQPFSRFFFGIYRAFFPQLKLTDLCKCLIKYRFFFVYIIFLSLMKHFSQKAYVTVRLIIALMFDISALKYVLKNFRRKNVYYLITYILTGIRYCKTTCNKHRQHDTIKKYSFCNALGF